MVHLGGTKSSGPVSQAKSLRHDEVDEGAQDHVRGAFGDPGQLVRALSPLGIEARQKM